MAAPVLSNIRIEVGNDNSPPYKSIDKLVWDNVPAFSVLTGLNGSGKTQLLEVLAHVLTRMPHPEFQKMLQIPVAIQGDAFGPESVAFVPNRWGIHGRQILSLAEMQNLKQQLFGNLQPHNVQHDPIMIRRKARLEAYFGVKNISELGIEKFMEKLPDDFSFMLDETDITTGLGHVFLSYRLRVAEHRERKIPEDEILRRVGPEPWLVLNDTLSTAGFPYRVTTPAGSRLMDPYEVMLEDSTEKTTLRPSDLSSGEQTLLSVVMWLYNSSHHGRFPRLFLLDEPDAHLHPSMTRQFLSVLHEVLSVRYGVRVIMTTHSPSTVALAPEGSLFEMRRSSPRIAPSPSRSETIGYLTSGLVVVSPGTRHVLVEDEDDVAFYEMIRNVLTDYGPTRDPRAIKSAPTLTFMPASLGSGKVKIAGGVSVVTQWLDKLRDPPLGEVFRGAIDRDSGNAPTKRLKVLRRYSIENYYLDPLVVYCVLSESGKAPAISGVSIPLGQEHLIRQLPSDRIQAIADTITALIEPVLAPLTAAETAKATVEFTNGVKVSYPAWIIDRRGHDLLPKVQSVFVGPAFLSPPRLSKAFMRIRLVPVELADLMDALQS